MGKSSNPCGFAEHKHLNQTKSLFLAATFVDLWGKEDAEPDREDAVIQPACPPLQGRMTASSEINEHRKEGNKQQYNILPQNIYFKHISLNLDNRILSLFIYI